MNFINKYFYLMTLNLSLLLLILSKKTVGTTVHIYNNKVRYFLLKFVDG